MGCGASTASNGAPPNNSASIKPLANGNAVHNNNSARGKAWSASDAKAALRNAHNTTVQLQNKDAPSETSTASRDSKRPLSSIDEGSGEVRTSIAVQTDFETIFGIKSQYIQTEHDLNPEDELELMMSEDAIADDDCSTERFGSRSSLNGSGHSSRSRRRANSHEESASALSKDSSDKKSMSDGFVDVGIQVKRTRTTSSQTLLKLGGKLGLSPEPVAPDRPTKPVSDLQRLWTAPTRGSDLLNRHISPKLHDFESQTDPISQALAANAAGNDLNVLHSYDISSPFSHIEKELGASAGLDPTQKGKRNFDIRLQECLNKLLDDMEDSYAQPRAVQRQDASVQTYNDPITDESPEYAARPPPSRKKEMIPSLNMFKEVDRRAVECPSRTCSTVTTLVEYLCRDVPNDLFKVRAIFRWIAHNIRFDWKYMGITLSASEVLSLGEGVCKDYCLLFGEMCRAAGLRVKKIQGFAKGYEYRPGYQFKPGEDIAHNWNAVYILGAWRLVDSTWGTGYTDHSGKFQRKINEHFFLTDPEVLIWSHFPHDDMESDYSRWQLLDKQLTLNDFNNLPKVTPNYFEFNLKIRTKLQSPITFRVQTEIKIGAHEPMRYKYKLYSTDEVENSSLNHYAFCQLKEDRLVGSFIMMPPVEGRYFLKVYTKPEREMLEGSTDSSSLHSVVTFLIECNRARKYIEPFPLNELPWGPTQAFYDFKMKIHNQQGPIISSWGGKRKLTIESVETMLVTNQIFDSEGMELDIRTIVMREDNGNKISFTITPPRVGMFKFMLFGMPKPKQKGKWRLPLLATFLVDCKLAKLPPQEEDPPPIPASAVPQEPERKRK